MNDKKIVFLTGATGAMGFETLKEFMKYPDRFELRLLVRPSRKNKKKLAHFMNERGLHIVWGDLTNQNDVEKALGNSEYVLHLGGMVSPMADHYPDKTMKVNVVSIKNIIEAVKKRRDSDNVKVIYIGSVAQTSNRMPPKHWGRIGDPVMPAKFDIYGVSKIRAEWLLANSGLKQWVSLRQTGILHKDLVFKASDPISFHVPLNGVLEWATVEDSARLMVNICATEKLPETFWRNFYNIGSGQEFRLTNYEFEKKLMESIGCPPPEKIFERNWFATRNFHGQWYEDSDQLEHIVPFRSNISADDYFKSLARKMPWWTRLSKIVPSPVIKAVMKRVALKKDLGTLDWLKRSDCEDRIEAFFGGRKEYDRIEDWKEFDRSTPSSQPVRLSHGFDESKPTEKLDIEDIQKCAEFRGGKCLSSEMETGNIDKPLEWECGFGHRFIATPLLILKGGHWCPECATQWNQEEQAEKNKFLAQLFEK